MPVDEEARAKEHQTILDVIEVMDQLDCNDWESDFLTSIANWTLTRTLTPAQARVVAGLVYRARNLPEDRGRDRKLIQKKVEERLKERPKAHKKTPQELWDSTPVPQKGDEGIFL